MDERQQPRRIDTGPTRHSSRAAPCIATLTAPQAFPYESSHLGTLSLGDTFTWGYSHLGTLLPAGSAGLSLHSAVPAMAQPAAAFRRAN